MGFLVFSCLALVSFGACMPVLPQAPLIEPEPRFGTALTTHLASRRQEGLDSFPPRTRVVPQFMFYGTVGVPAQEETDFGARLTAYTSLLAFGMDGFVSAPMVNTGPWDAGAGAIVQLGGQEIWGPYVSVGRSLGRGNYLWLTQGAARVKSQVDSTSSWLGTSFVGIRQMGRRRTTISVFFGATFGYQDTRCGSVCRPATRAWIGYAAETPMTRFRPRTQGQ